MPRPEEYRGPGTKMGGRVYISLTGAKGNLSKVVNLAHYGRERFVIMRQGQPAAAVVGTGDLERLMQMEQSEFFGRVEELERMLEAMRDLKRPRGG